MSTQPNPTMSKRPSGLAAGFVALHGRGHGAAADRDRQRRYPTPGSLWCRLDAADREPATH